MLTRTPEPPSYTAFTALIPRLDEAQAEEKEAIRLGFRQMGPDALDCLNVWIQKQWRTLQCRFWMLHFSGVIGLSVMCPFLLAGAWQRPVFWIPTGLSFGAVVGARRMATRQTKALLGRMFGVLEVFEDVRTVAWLLPLLQANYKPLLPAVIERLLILLPRIEKEHAVLISPELRQVLRQVLTLPYRRETPELASVCLQALVRLKDRETLPLLRSLTMASATAPAEQCLLNAAREAVSTLQAQIEDAEFQVHEEALQQVGRLLETYHHAADSNLSYNEDVMLKTKLKLVFLMPHVTVEQMDRFTRPQREALRFLLENCDPDQEQGLLLATLRVVGELGEPLFLPGVQRMARRQRGRVQEAAQACLLRLEERQVEDHQRRTLLRPSQEGVTSQEELLRPATGATEADGQVLLRPSGE